MRPVLLEMNGFAAFREPTTVDFTDADYFALVGPTGAGKSTVIDAMTFALYGSVPRWDNQRTVALALAPTAGRGAVRLVFDLDGRRYVVARELRRAASGGVSVRGARLERLADPDGRGGVEEETEPIADGAAATTDAVQELLGLPFGDFCTCVVLPQGDFAEFLHAEPRKRQEKLVRILGLGLYEVIAKAANSEAAEQKARAGLLAEQLRDYTDATPEAERAATARVAELDGLAARIGAAVPELAAAGDARRAAVDAVERARAEQALLRALDTPAGLERLHEREGATAGAVAAATQRLAAAEHADGDARSRLAAAPDRARLDQLRRDHAELAAGVAELPGLTERVEKASAGYELAIQDAADGRAALDRARSAREGAAAALAGAAGTVERLVAERDGFRGVAPPAGLTELDARRATALAGTERAEAALAAAEEADGRARAEQAAAPARPPLEQARRDGRAMAETRERRARAADALAAARRGRATAEAAAAEAEHRWRHARERWAGHQRADLAATLRSTLRAGADCPVCAQPVAELPAGAPAAELAAADLAGSERAAADAELAHREATREAAAADAAVHAAEQALAGLDETADRLRAGLVDAVRRVLDAAPAEGGALYERLAEGLRAAGPDPAPQPADPAEPGALALFPLGDEPAEHVAGGGADADLAALGTALDDVLAALDRLAERAAAADADVRTARRDRTAAAAAAAAVRTELGAAVDRLRAARDPLVAFGAPAPADDDVLAGWTALVGWAEGAAAARERDLPAARAAAAAATDALAAAEREWATAERTARDRRAEETAAARAEQEARDALAVLDRRVRELRVALADAPADDDVVAELARRDRLEAAAAAAEAELRAARGALRAAEGAAAEVGREVGAAWQALRAARDPLVGLDAPALPDDDLRAAWATLTGWATERARAGAARLAAAAAAAAAAERERAAVDRRIGDDLAAHGVALDGPPSAALPAVVAAAERARGLHQRLVERRADAARIAADRDAADAAQQVARMLGGLLRSDGFPRWLVASALDALVADASAGLLELSGGQFELTHAGGEFLVIDHADADARRPVKTLSGGETFQASLALALALSAQLSGLAAAGAPKLESIFLDEGFGTLDEANLEIVAATLENLAARGDRMVGLITHVPALAERVPVRFRVSRDERTASVTREDL